MRYILTAVLAGAACVACASPAMAAVSVSNTNGDPLDNKIFGIKAEGTTVYGSAPNNNGPANVTFTANTTVGMGNGFAQINDATPRTPDWTWLIINPDDAFTSLKWAVQLTGSGTVSVYYLLTGSGMDANNPLSYTSLAGTYGADNSDLKKLLTGDAGEIFDGILIKTTAPIDFFEVKQMSYNGLTPAVPEPSTWALMLLGFGGIGLTMRRRRRDGSQLQIA